MKLRFILAFFATALFCALALAQPLDTADQLARWADDAAFLIVRADISRADPAGLFTELANSPTFKADAGQRQALDKSRDDVKAWRDEFLAAGGKEVWAIASLSDIADRHPPGPPLFLVVPAANAPDRDRLRKCLIQIPDIRDADIKSVEGFLVAGKVGRVGPASEEKNAPMPRIPLDRPTRAAAIRAALNAAEASPVQVLLIPADFARRAFEEMAPTLPAQLGGGPITTITQGVTWGAASLSLPPDGSFRMTAQSKDPAAAEALSKLIGELADRAAKAATVPEFEKLAAALKPRLDGDRLRWSFEKDEFRAVLGQVTAALATARRQARGLMIATELRSIIMGCMTWAADHKDAWPDTLDQLVGPGYIPAEMIKNTGPNRRPPIYRKPAPDDFQKRPSITVVLHEAFDKWPSEGLWVGFADGHVDHIADKAKFDEFLKPAK
jgi:hypothetical protein